MKIELSQEGAFYKTLIIKSVQLNQYHTDKTRLVLS